MTQVVVLGDYQYQNLGEDLHIFVDSETGDLHAWWYTHNGQCMMPVASREETCVHIHLEVHPYVTSCNYGHQGIIHGFWFPTWDKYNNQILANSFGLEFRKLPGTLTQDPQIAFMINGTDIWTRNSIPTPTNSWDMIEYDIFMYYSTANPNNGDIFFRFTIIEDDVVVYDGQDDIFDSNDFSFFNYFKDNTYGPCKIGVSIVTGGFATGSPVIAPETDVYLKEVEISIL